MELVILAAGHGRRFGGLKQLAEVGPGGEALIDYTAIDAHSCGFDKIVLVVREAIQDELLEHVRKHWPSDLECEAVCQRGIAGTAQAVLSATAATIGDFGVANADDYYGRDALVQLHDALGEISQDATAGAGGPGVSPASGGGSAVSPAAPTAAHVLLGFRLADTVFTHETVTRGVCRVDQSGLLVDIVEQRVTALPGEDSGFGGVPIDAEPESPSQPLSGDEIVSMNLWGFQPRMTDHLAHAVAAFDAPAPGPGENPPELLLPNVVKSLVSAGSDSFRVIGAKGRCIGMTHVADLDFVRRQIGGRKPGDLVTDFAAKPIL